jgi:hypothetical protein
MLHQLLEYLGYYNQLSFQNDVCTYILVYHPRFDDDDIHVTGKVASSRVPKEGVQWRCGHFLDLLTKWEAVRLT